MSTKNKVKISAGLNYFLHKKIQEHCKTKNISLTYLIEVALELYFEEERKGNETKQFQEKMDTIVEILIEMTTRIDELKNAK